jgi:hypothetical protein
MAANETVYDVSANQIILHPMHNPPAPTDKTPWITITVAGATAGVVVAAITYATTSTTTSAMASATGFTIDMLGELISAGVTYVMGYVAGYTVKFASKTAAKTAEETMKHSGMITAAVLSSAAGAATALSITIGTRLVEYSVQYGGKMSKELAVQLSEAYLRFRASRSSFETTGNVCELLDDEWVMVVPSPALHPVDDEVHTFATPANRPFSSDSRSAVDMEPLTLDT